MSNNVKWDKDMINDPRKNMKSGNVCFRVEVVFDHITVVKITDYSHDTDSRIVERQFTVGSKYPLAHVRRGCRSKGGLLEYVVDGVITKLEQGDSVNAVVRYSEDLETFEIISVTPEHELRNLLGQISQISSKKEEEGAPKQGKKIVDPFAIKPLDTAFDGFSTVIPDRRSSRRLRMDAPRRRQRGSNAVGKDSAEAA